MTMSEGPADVRDLSKAEETFAAMQNAAPVIYQGVLRDAESRTYGAPDLLVRSDELQRLFPGALSEEEVSDSSPGLGFWPWHYRVVDIKFTTLDLLAGGEISNGGSKLAYKAQLFVYNRALGRLQGYEPSRSYLLGRGWSQRRRPGRQLHGTAWSRGAECQDSFRLYRGVDQSKLASGYAGSEVRVPAGKSCLSPTCLNSGPIWEAPGMIPGMGPRGILRKSLAS